MEQEWRRSGAGVEQESRSRAGVEQEWSKGGAGVEQKWSRSGAENTNKQNGAKFVLVPISCLDNI